MPYIKKDRKEALASGDLPKNGGEVNYLITLDLINRWKDNPRYSTIEALAQETAGNSSPSPWKHLSDATVHAARFLAFLEFYRRVGEKYEDLKIKENGDVYPRDAALWEEIDRAVGRKGGK